MSQYVLDASVIVKWLIPENPAECNVEEVWALLSAKTLPLPIQKIWKLQHAVEVEG